MLTESQKKLRKGRLTASRISSLMEGDEEEILWLWLALRQELGLEEFCLENSFDLSKNFQVRLGELSEDLNLEFYEFQTKRKISRKGEVVINSFFPWMACTLDGWDEDLKCPVECKHVGEHFDMGDIVTRYYPQVTYQMLVTQTAFSFLSVIFGTRDPMIQPIEIDRTYSKEMMRRATSFMDSVFSGTMPSIPEPMNYSPTENIILIAA